MHALTPDLVRALWRDSCAHYRTRARHKADSALMRAVGHGLGALRILERRRFLERYTTVMFRTIYHPFALGVADDLELAQQVIICTHEHQHVVQFEREGYPLFSARYLLSSRRRALYEAEAYGCNLELQWWFWGYHDDPGQLAEVLSDYGCSMADIDAAAQALAQTAEALSHGRVRTQASRFTIAWLERHAPGLSRA